MYVDCTDLNYLLTVAIVRENTLVFTFEDFFQSGQVFAEKECCRLSLLHFKGPICLLSSYRMPGFMS